MFYAIRQNNSGGYFIDNDYVSHIVIVEAKDEYDAEDLINRIVDDYSEYCPCCGQRWSYWNLEGTELPMYGGKPIQEFLDSKDSCYMESAIVYYADGRKVRHSVGKSEVHFK